MLGFLLDGKKLIPQGTLQQVLCLFILFGVLFCFLQGIKTEEEE